VLNKAKDFIAIFTTKKLPPISLPWSESFGSDLVKLLPTKGANNFSNCPDFIMHKLLLQKKKA